MDRRLGMVLAAALPLITGCFMFQGSGPNYRYVASVDDKQFELEQTYYLDALRPGPARNYGELLLIVKQEGREILRHPVARRPGVFREHPHYVNVECRIDPTGQKIWFIDKDSHHVFVSADLMNGLFTGYDDAPPSWARLDGGQAINCLATQ